MKTMLNLVGDKYGRLLVLKDTGKERKPGNRIFLCRCECGTEKEIPMAGLRLKRNGTKSCGCLGREIAKKSIWVAIRHSTMKDRSIPAFNKLYGYYKGAAKRRMISFDLEKDAFRKLIGQRCFYCHQKPMQINKLVNSHYVYNGIDRINNEEGYIEDNVVSCCGFCNVMKSSHTQESFIRKVADIYENLKRKHLIVEEPKNVSFL